METAKFRLYLNELETLTEAVRRAPGLSTAGQGLPREEMLRRFEMARNLVNLLHLTTIHLMRAMSNDYDRQSETWILTSIDHTVDEVRGTQFDGPLEHVRALADQCFDLVHRVITDMRRQAA